MTHQNLRLGKCWKLFWDTLILKYTSLTLFLRFLTVDIRKFWQISALDIYISFSKTTFSMTIIFAMSLYISVFIIDVRFCLMTVFRFQVSFFISLSFKIKLVLAWIIFLLEILSWNHPVLAWHSFWHAVWSRYCLCLEAFRCQISVCGNPS